ncbi:hypothetical protein FN846DRAFT_1021771 [Sphaerosporella brunnea]|uniref:Glycoside hydrolase 131 catalytic N-terminal domain-containing protein n=1 Tax=Sphaerosporella brunnea TaxID=1250544 RepID=A0A5J5EVR2_9PEZI|nr:hypothetical protein FN846DRAFT_1021771 [Sphaerosporella brunnea]
MVFTSLFTALLLAVGSTHALSDIIWDGRIPRSFPLSDFDSSKLSPYNAGYNHGLNQTWAKIIKFPRVPPSKFDIISPRSSTKPLEVTIDDESIFQPGDASTRQNGFRRSELMPNINNGSDITVQNITTLHFSIMKDLHRPLNISHLYQICFLETADYSSHVWTLSTGSGSSPPGNPKALRLESSTAGGVEAKRLFEVDFTGNIWHNFAIQVDFDHNALKAFYSAGNAPLKRVVNIHGNDATGRGQYHLGLIKQPTGNPSDVVHQGYQPSGINEGLIFGGIFIEKGAAVTTKNCLKK